VKLFQRLLSCVFFFHKTQTQENHESSYFIGPYL
jgi:hypothetical protein